MNNPSEAVATSEENPGPSPLSILDVLRAPTHMELTRMRKIDSNPPPKGHCAFIFALRNIALGGYLDTHKHLEHFWHDVQPETTDI